MDNEQVMNQARPAPEQEAGVENAQAPNEEKLSLEEAVAKAQQEDASETILTSAEEEAEAASKGEQILREKDKESKYRRLTGPWAVIAAVISVMFVVYHVYTSRFGMPEMFRHRAIHLGFLLTLAWIYYPSCKKANQKRPSVMDIILMLLTVTMTVFTFFNIVQFNLRSGVAMPIDYVFGAICILLVIEAVRRVIGWQLTTLVVIFLLYAYFGPYVPGVFMHKGYNIKRIIYQMYLTTQGIFGVPLGVSATYMIIFIVLASMLSQSGLGKLFNDMALSVSGKAAGGPAKVAVVASAMMGMINGGAANNVATTGAFTIPLMKRVGYQNYFAGAVEAAASTGGQIMPPIMGTVAFIMAEFVGVPYVDIALAAIIPSVLYFAAVFFQVDLRARKLNLQGIGDAEIPDVKATIKRYGHMIIPVIVLVFLLIKQYTPIYSAFYCCILAWLLALLRKETRLGPKELLTMAVEAARGCLSVGIAMAGAGFIIGVLGMTGIGLILADNIVTLSRGILLIALLLSMVVSIILGMGLPTSACYIIASSIACPILLNMGVDKFQAHFFVLYFACLSTVTPPVALASYVGAGMAGADPGKVGWAAFKLAAAGFIVPFFFIYAPEMLLIADSPFDIVWAAVTGLIGTYLLAVACEGYFKMPLPVYMRIVSFGAAICLMIPGIQTDIIGAGLIVLLLLYVVLKGKSNKMKAQAGA